MGAPAAPLFSQSSSCGDVVAVSWKGPEVEEELTIPQSIRLLRDALRPIAAEVNKRINGAPPSGEWLDDLTEFVSSGLQRIEDDIEALIDTVNSDLDGVLAGEAGDADVWRAAARLEVHMERLLDGYDEARGAVCGDRDTEGLSLLADAYRNVLKQVRGWLNEIVEFVEEPFSALRKRGLDTEGKEKLVLFLTFETPTEIADVRSWMERRAADSAAHAPRHVAEDRGDTEAGHIKFNVVIDSEPEIVDELQRIEERQRIAEERGLMLLLLGAFGLGWMFGGDE